MDICVDTAVFHGYSSSDNSTGVRGSSRISSQITLREYPWTSTDKSKNIHAPSCGYPENKARTRRPGFKHHRVCPPWQPSEIGHSLATAPLKYPLGCPPGYPLGYPFGYPLGYPRGYPLGYLIGY